MCGITGIISFNSSAFKNDEIIIKMTNALAHRGPDADGFFVDDEIALGHRRLSIIDLSSAANQPFFDHSGRYTIVFNGEMYNYEEVRSLLKDYPFKTSGDTETLIAAYAKWGINCLSYFKGMFAFAIWDKKEKELCIVRDRMGVKPLYYYLDDKKLLFASEVRSLLASQLIEHRISKKGLFEFFSYQSISYPLTIIEGIKQLEAGSYLSIKEGLVTKKKYWNLLQKTSDVISTDAAGIQADIHQLLLKSVQRRLVSDVPVGAFLSGGIDSSAVVGLMAEECNIRPATFNVSFSEKKYDESAYAEIIAKRFRTHHTKIQLSPTVMLDELENALSAMDTPSGDGINTYVVSKAIKNAGISVALSGIGGDELFAGYPIFDQFKKLHSKKSYWKSTFLLRRLASFLLGFGEVSSKKLRLQQLMMCNNVNIENIYPLLRQMLAPQLIQKILNLKETGTTSLKSELQKHAFEFADFPELSQVTTAEYMGYSLNTLLKDTDQMSMAVALEVREPFFDSDLIEYILKIPDHYKSSSFPKGLLVESVAPLIPEEVVFRKKQGFAFPWDLWMRNELRSFCDTHINRLCERDFVNSYELKQYWKSFLNNNKYSPRWMDMWLFIVLEYWLEKNGAT